MPAAPDLAALAAAAADLSSFAALLAAADGDALHATLRELAVIIVDEAGVHLRYHEPYAPLIPAPTGIPLLLGRRGRSPRRLSISPPDLNGKY